MRTVEVAHSKERVLPGSENMFTPYKGPVTLTKLTPDERARAKRMYDSIPLVTRKGGEKIDDPYASKGRVSEQFLVESAGVEKAIRGEPIRPGTRTIIMERVAAWEAGQPIAKARRSLKTRKRR